MEPPRLPQNPARTGALWSESFIPSWCLLAPAHWAESGPRGPLCRTWLCPALPLLQRLSDPLTDVLSQELCLLLLRGFCTVTWSQARLPAGRTWTGGVGRIWGFWEGRGTLGHGTNAAGVSGGDRKPRGQGGSCGPHWFPTSAPRKVE